MASDDDHQTQSMETDDEQSQSMNSNDDDDDDEQTESVNSNDDDDDEDEAESMYTDDDEDDGDDDEDDEDDEDEDEDEDDDDDDDDDEDDDDDDDENDYMDDSMYTDSDSDDDLIDTDESVESVEVNSKYKYVIVGGGVCAGYAAREFIRQGVRHGELAIFCKEKVPPYERPIISKEYLNPKGGPRLPSFNVCTGTGGELMLEEWYEEHGITLFLDTEIVDTDLDDKLLFTEEDETYEYEILIIATGSEVTPLTNIGLKGSHAKNIIYLNSVDDADTLLEAMEAKRGGKAVVLGGGYLGVEISSALIDQGFDTSMVYLDPWLMPKIMSEEMATEFFEVYIQNRGIHIYKATNTLGFTTHENGEVKGVRLRDGPVVEADIVVVSSVGSGPRPYVGVFADQLEEDKYGIMVDEYLRASADDVFAVGDCAAFPIDYFEDTKRFEHVEHARSSAEYAVKTIFALERGDDEIDEYDYVPHLHSRAMGLSWHSYGFSMHEAVTFGNMDPTSQTPKFGAFWIRDGRVCGTFLEGGTTAENAAMAKVAEVRPEYDTEEELKQEGLEFAFRVKKVADVDDTIRRARRKAALEERRRIALERQLRRVNELREIEKKYQGLGRFAQFSVPEAPSAPISLDQMAREGLDYASRIKIVADTLEKMSMEGLAFATRMKTVADGERLVGKRPVLPPSRKWTQFREKKALAAISRLEAKVEDHQATGEVAEPKPPQPPNFNESAKEEMRVISAFLLAVTSGNADPSASDLKKILSTTGGEIDDARIESLLSEIKGKNIMELIAAGREKLASVPTSGEATKVVQPSSPTNAKSSSPASPEIEEEKIYFDDSDDKYFIENMDYDLFYDKIVEVEDDESFIFDISPTLFD